MSSAKRPYNETTLNDSNDYVVNIAEEEQLVGEQDMDVENEYQRKENFVNTRRRLNTDEDDLEDRFKSSAFVSNPFPSTLNNRSFKSSSSASSTRNSFNYSSRNTTTSTTSLSRNTTTFHKVSQTTSNVTHHPLSDNIKSNFISPRDSLNNNTYNNNSNSTLKVSDIKQEAKAPSPVDLLMSSPPISTSTPKTNQTRNMSNTSNLTLTTNANQGLDDIWISNSDSDYTRANTNTSDSSAEAINSTYSHAFSNDNNDFSPNNENINNNSSNIDNIDNSNDFSSNSNNFSYNNNINNFSRYDTMGNSPNIRTHLKKCNSKGPFSPVYSQIYDNKGMVVDMESFNYLVQLYEFCDDSSSKLQSIITSTLAELVIVLDSQIDNFDIPFIEHHKWNGSSFYGSIDVITLLDQLDDGLGLASTEYVYYDRNYHNDPFTRTGISVLQSGYRKTYHVNTSTPLDDSELRHAVLDKDAEREAQLFLESLAEEDDDVVDNGTDQEENSTEEEDSSDLEESDSFTEISSDDGDDDDGSLIRGFASASIRQSAFRATDTFGNPVNLSRATSNITRRISRPNDGNETDDSLDDCLVDNGNLTESTFEEVDFPDVDSIATDSTEDDWQDVLNDN